VGAGKKGCGVVEWENGLRFDVACFHSETCWYGGSCEGGMMTVPTAAGGMSETTAPCNRLPLASRLHTTLTFVREKKADAGTERPHIGFRSTAFALVKGVGGAK
jgi:hypothetical protein